MKRVIILLITLIFSIPFTANAENDLFKDLEGYSFPHNFLNTIDNNITIFKKFIGDTIVLNVKNANFVKCIISEKPDTVWLKKRPKKNSELGKHYILNNAYKGIENNGSFETPVSEINGKPFIVSAVGRDVTYSSYYSSPVLILSLIEPSTREQINIRLSESPEFIFDFISRKVSKLMEKYIGREIYYAPDIKSYSSTKPEYKKYRIDSGDVFFRLDKDTRCFGIRSVSKITLMDDSGAKFTATPRYVKQALYTYAPFILPEEYESSFKKASINSEVDMAIIDKAKNFPFSFKLIIGVTDNFTEIYQTIDPAKSYTPADAYLSTKVIAIGDVVKLKGKDYFKACYNGKAFFVPQNKVKIIENSTLYLDTLKNCPVEIRTNFFNYTLAMSKLVFADIANDNIAKVDSYSKYGIAIPWWGVYDMSKYTDGTGVKFEFYNPTKYTIKYITVTFQGYNAVDDPVGRPITKKCIGPVEPEETATYDFEYAWFTDIIDYAKLRSIVVQYKNGTTKTISNAANIVFPDKLYEWFFLDNPVDKLK